MPMPRVLFSDFFGVSSESLEEHGAFDVSLVGDLPLFIDPFLLFNSDSVEYRELHDGIIRYLAFLRDKSVAGDVTPGLLRAWYHFGEVKETWLGFSQRGNRGSGLGDHFAKSLDRNFGRLFSEESGRITRGRHLEKLCLIGDRVGRDCISDFTTNLIKGFLLEYTERFARERLDKPVCAVHSVPRAAFSYATESWETRRHYLPTLDGTFVLLVPKDILTRDDTWINKDDLVRDFQHLPAAIPDAAIRSQVDNYFRKALPVRPKEGDRKEAARRTIAAFPDLIDYFIRRKEDTGARARSLSDEKVRHSEELFAENFARLVALLAGTGFYGISGDSYEEALARVGYLKHVVESNDGYRLFYVDGKPVQREEDLQVAYRFTWYGSPLDVNREVNNGRGPVDYKISMGAADVTLVEFKLASNSQLKANLKNQVAVYEEANRTRRSIKVILFFSAAERAKVERIMKDLGLTDSPNVVLIDARRDNKQSASKVR